MHALLPDQEEMEEAIDVFLSHMEQQETRGFKDLHSIWSKLPMPTPAPGRTFTWTRLLRLGSCGALRARCYLFDMNKHRFHRDSMNPQVV